jgi:hypothetical protein
MANYGELLEDFNPERDEIYLHFVKYFNNPTMTKVKDIDRQFSMYAAKVYSMLANENRYLICITYKNNMNIGTVEELRTMNWISFQTRRLTDIYKCITHSYIPKLEGELDTLIIREHFDKISSTYKCEKFPSLIITLLHTDKKPQESYQNRGKIINSLETYETIITFKE